MVEEVIAKLPGKPLSHGLISLPVPLTEITVVSGERLITGIGELDRVLGGGVLRGSVNLIGHNAGRVIHGTKYDLPVSNKVHDVL